jgi:hypothetical protein
LSIVVLLLCTTVVLPSDVLYAEIKAEAELRRLQMAAEDASAEDDPSGAALFSGRAALMAIQLKNEAISQEIQEYYRRVEQLFRGQERLYRAMAMFKLGGGQPPASDGVCGMLDHARRLVDVALNGLVSHVEIEAIARELSERARIVGGEYLCITEAP